MYGQAPQLKQLDGNGNLAFAVDFRSVYATAIEKWWNVSSSQALGGKHPLIEVLKT